jgi:hypothetical protein
MIFRCGLLLCKNHPLDDLQEKNLLVKRRYGRRNLVLVPAFPILISKGFWAAGLLGIKLFGWREQLKDYGKY